MATNKNFKINGDLICNALKVTSTTEVTNLNTNKLQNRLASDLLHRDGGTNSSMLGYLTLHADPISPMHAATKQYVDNLAAGLDPKGSVRVATTSNITLSNIQTIDGISLVSGDRVLVKNQTTQSQNGIYVVSNLTWTRSEDANNTPAGEVTSGMYCFVEEGTVNNNTGWILTTVNPIVLGTTNLVFTQFSGVGNTLAGNGLTNTGNVFNVNTASASRIVVNTDNIDLALVSNSGTGSFLKFNIDSYGRVTGTTAVLKSDVDALNINADTLDSQDGLFYRNSSNINAGTLSVSYGGTGANDKTNAFDNLSPTSMLGDIICHNGTDNIRLAGNTTTVRQFLSQTGSGVNSAVPQWATLSYSDISNLNSWPGNGNITTLGILPSIELQNGNITSNTIIINSNNITTTIDSLPSSQYTTIEYLIQLKQASNYNTTKILAIHDGINVYLNETNQISSNDIMIGLFDINITAGNIVLQFSSFGDATVNNITIKLIRTAINT